MRKSSAWGCTEMTSISDVFCMFVIACLRILINLCDLMSRLGNWRRRRPSNSEGSRREDVIRLVNMGPNSTPGGSGGYSGNLLPDCHNLVDSWLHVAKNNSTRAVCGTRNIKRAGYEVRPRCVCLNACRRRDRMERLWWN